jgi:hypothetical protein
MDYSIGTQEQTQMAQTLKQIVDEMKHTDVLEDRREYDIDDLAQMYDLDYEAASKLFEMVQAEFR